MSAALGAHVLVVDDDAAVRQLIDEYLRANDFRVTAAGDGRELMAAFRSQVLDLVLLDLRLRADDGMQLLQQLRAESQIPVIILTGRAEEADRVMGLELGADDYLTKPFSPRELVARVKAHLRRAGRDEEENAAVESGPFKLDRGAHRVFLRERELNLTSTEYKLLEFFLTHAGRAYSRDQLLEEVWGQQRFVTPRTVDVHVRRLREHIEAEPDNPRFLTTVRGFGYRFEDPA
jgi:DNA-binding response OmpR family regulator